MIELIPLAMVLTSSNIRTDYYLEMQKMHRNDEMKRYAKFKDVFVAINIVLCQVMTISHKL